MYKIVAKQVLNPTVVRMEIQAPYVAKKAQAGQFVILRVDDRGERIPLTVADYNRTAGTVTIIFQLVGATTKQLARLEVGDSLQDFVGPLGNPTKVTGYRKVAVVGGGVGCAIAYPVAKALHENGAQVHSIVGFRTKDLVILQQEFEKVSDRYVLMSDDGSVGEKGLVTNALESLIQSGEQYDLVIAIGPLVMMKFVCKTTEKYGIHTVVSMNPIMIDGTGMPFSNIVDTGLHEIEGYCIMTGHNPTLSGVFINEASWNKLSEDDQKILEQAGVEARQAVYESFAANEEAARAAIAEKGMVIIEKDELSFDTDAIRDSVAEKFKDDWGDIFQEIMEYLGKA